MALTRRLFKYHRFAMYHIAAIQIQWAWRGFLERKKKILVKSKDLVAVEKLQKAWRSYTNVKIFRYYKDLINFKEK
jgi:myosin heavy subunit